MILTGALAVGGWAATGTGARAEAARPATDPTRTSLHYEVDFKAGSGRIYAMQLDSTLFAAMTGRSATIDPAVGGAFALFGGVIVGRNVELVPGLRIVQAWRPTYWEAGFFSMVRFALGGKGPQARLVLDHWGFPSGDADSLDSGWKEHYLDPMARYLARTVG